MKLEDLIPSSNNQQVECPPSYDRVFFIDSVNLCINSYSTITGRVHTLLSLKEYVTENNQIQARSKDSSCLVFTDLQHRWVGREIKFLFSWIDPLATTSQHKYLFSWLTFNLHSRQI